MSTPILYNVQDFIFSCIDMSSLCCFQIKIWFLVLLMITFCLFLGPIRPREQWQEQSVPCSLRWVSSGLCTVRRLFCEIRDYSNAPLAIPVTQTCMHTHTHVCTSSSLCVVEPPQGESEQNVLHLATDRGFHLPTLSRPWSQHTTNKLNKRKNTHTHTHKYSLVKCSRQKVADDNQ